MLVMWKVDHLGPTMNPLVGLAAELAKRKAGLRLLTDGMTSDTAGKLVFHIMATVAEMERDLS
ncbi:MAG: recombinase family protein [Sphingomonas phyllosphaerae]|uniref:recombinase family protein n=1 Tax=Sphingomonas phyllosphaerae TaxID=257003 RepID=UPI002FFC6FBC